MQWLLDGPLSLSNPVQMGLRDLDGAALPAPADLRHRRRDTSKATVDALHAMGKKVICYVDAGVYERRARTPPSSRRSRRRSGQRRRWAGRASTGSTSAASTTSRRSCRRVSRVQGKGFDAHRARQHRRLEQQLRLPAHPADQIAYNRALADWAHGMGLSIGLKNDLEQAHPARGRLRLGAQRAVLRVQRVHHLKAFAQAGKAVWIAEYKDYGSQWARLRGLTGQSLQHGALQAGPQNGGRQPCTGTW